jgi:hypothetical protein
VLVYRGVSGGHREADAAVVLYEIVDAVAYPDHTVSITWSDGVRGVVDFLPIIDRGGWFTPLRDPLFRGEHDPAAGRDRTDLAGGDRLFRRWTAARSVSERGAMKRWQALR